MYMYVCIDMYNTFRIIIFLKPNFYKSGRGKKDKFCVSKAWRIMQPLNMLFLERGFNNMINYLCNDFKKNINL